jgi:sodium/pantothenate symporter
MSAYTISGWILVAVYIAVAAYFVIRGAKKTRTMNDYAVGNIAFSPVAVGLALAASMTSAATFIINPGFIALYGISGVWSYAIFLPIAALASLYFFTKGFRKHGESVKALTLSQWMKTRYDSPFYGIFFGILALLMITFIVLITVGLTKVLSKTLAIDELWALVGIVIVVFGYMMFGGANSMVYTNTIQAGMMIIVALILLGSGYHYFGDGVSGFLAQLKAIDPHLVNFTNPKSFLFRDFFEIVIAQIIVGVAIVMQPHIITKSLLLKTDKDVNRYLTAGIITETLFFFVVFAGLYARLTFPDLMVNGEALKMDGIISAYVLQRFPVWIGLIVIMGLLAAGMSTLEGLIQSVSTTITIDLLKPLTKKLRLDAKISESGWTMINKGVIAIIGFVAFLLSWEQLVNPKLSVAIFAQNGVYAYFAAAFVPILFGMFLKSVQKASVITASFVAIVVHFSMYYGKLSLPFTISTGENPGVAAASAIVAALCCGLLVHSFQKKKG